MTSLYDLLGVSEDASVSEITKAYRIQALKYHPDKTGGESSDQFIAIKQAYDVLVDPQKRNVYDRTGQVDFDVKLTAVNEGGVVEAQDILLFAKTYPNSQDERDDIRDYYNRVKGNIVDIFDCIPLTEPSEAQYTRLISIIDDLIDSKVISTTPKYKSTATKLKEALPALQKKQKREHKKFHEEHGDTTFEDLVAKIKANQAKRAKKGIHNILDQKITTLKKQTKNKSSKS